jgi:hypothetical protein
MHDKIVLIIVSFILFIYGLYSYFYQRSRQWVKVSASIERVEIIKRIEKDAKMKTLAIYLKFNKGSISYFPVFTSDSVENLKEKINDKFITIYYKNENPNISYLQRPQFGLIRLISGLVLFAMSLVYYYADLIFINNITDNLPEKKLI